MSADVIGVIESTYSNEPDDAAWVRHIAEAAAPALERGQGVFAGVYNTAGGRMHLEVAHGIGPSVHHAEVFRRAHELMPAELVSLLYNRGPFCGFGRKRAGMTQEAYKGNPVIVATDAGSQGTVSDAIGVVSGGALHGCLIMAPVRETIPIPRPLTDLWTRIAAHLAAAVRIRRAPESARSEAVLAPSGRIEHAEGIAREPSARGELSEAAKRIDRARGTMRRKDPAAAVALWRALVAGRWSLVDHFDHDGRRFLLARPNEIPAVSLTSLTPAERQVLALAILGHSNKLIAYQLGLTPSAAAMRLSRLARKLGARTRVELIEKCRGPGLRLADRQ
jgi:DNA-binding CsgD family transcriptional regulator